MSNLRVSLAHPLGSPFSRNVALALWEAGLLSEIITAIAYQPDGALAHWLKCLPTTLSQKLAAELGRRTWVAPEGARLKTYPQREILRMALVKSGLSRRLGISYQGLADWVYAGIDRQVASHHLKGLAGIYAYEDGAAETFQAAKQQGLKCFYDLPIVFHETSRAIQAEEADRFPELASALQAAHEPPQKVARKQQELALADHIFVPSSFVKDSLCQVGVPAKKISAIPFGAPIEYFQPQPKPDDLFRVLFVGRVGPRKGVHYLLQAWQALNLPQAELVLVGVNELPPDYLARYQQNNMRHVPSVPHAQLDRYYTSASVMVLPSLAEGLALVQLEAMACGIPLITTFNAGGTDILTDGLEGFIVPIRDVEALKAKLEWCYRHPEALVEMGHAARRRAEKLTWAAYRQQIRQQIETQLQGNSYAG